MRTYKDIEQAKKPAKIREYAILNASSQELSDWLEEMAVTGTDLKPLDVIFKSQDVEAIIDKLQELGDVVVEEYLVNAEGEFIEGSDYDTAQNFLERNK